MAGKKDKGMLEPIEETTVPETTPEEPEMDIVTFIAAKELNPLAKSRLEYYCATHNIGRMQTESFWNELLTQI